MHVEKHAGLVVEQQKEEGARGSMVKLYSYQGHTVYLLITK